MKKLLGAVSVVTLLASGGVALADDAAGTVAAVDVAAGTLSLEDGTAFVAGEGVSLEGLEAGANVTVTYEVQGEQNVATAVSKAE